jgi:hypothetical protein
MRADAQKHAIGFSVKDILDLPVKKGKEEETNETSQSVSVSTSTSTDSSPESKSKSVSNSATSASFASNASNLFLDSAFSSYRWNPDLLAFGSSFREYQCSNLLCRKLSSLKKSSVLQAALTAAKKKPEVSRTNSPNTPALTFGTLFGSFSLSKMQNNGEKTTKVTLKEANRLHFDFLFA